MKEGYILGINDGVISGSAVINRDGEICAAVNEERLIRKKMAIGFPAESISEVLRISAIDAADVSEIAIATFDEYFRDPAEVWNGWFQGDRGLLKELQLSMASRIASVLGSNPIAQGVYYVARLPASWNRKRKLEKALRERWGFTCPITFVDHHYAHVAAAYYTSGFDHATVISIDGGGDGKSCKVYEGKEGKLRELGAVSAYDSIGNFYAYITHLCGFKAHKHEGKVTGLAALGNPKYLDVLRRHIKGSGGDIKNIGRSFYTSALKKIRADLPDDYDQKDLASSVQQHLEETCVPFVKYWVHKTGLGNLALAGGVVANVKLNQRIHEIAEVDEMYVYPAMGDDGLAVGAAYCLWSQQNFEKLKTEGNNYQPRDVYFGAGFSDEEIEGVLNQYDLKYVKSDNLCTEVAKLLADGQVVARFEGRMEYGPRALGNRTIMYQPTDPSANTWLNDRLVRSEFMPFAPVTLEEYADQCFINLDGVRRATRFMTITLDCTEWMKEACPAVVHVDGTARPQLVNRENEPNYYGIIDEYRKLTGLPCVVNTSFNMHEEPIVCTPYDAVRAFLVGNLDYLAIGDYIVKYDNKSDWHETFGFDSKLVEEKSRLATAAT